MVRPRFGRRLRVRDRRQVHQVLLQPRLVLVARLQLAHVLVLQDGEDESLIFVEVFLNELGRDHLLGGVPVSLDGRTSVCVWGDDDVSGRGVKDERGDGWKVFVDRRG